jgi:transposase
MRQKSGPEKQPAEDAIRDIRRATCRLFSAEEKIRVVLEGLRGEERIADGERFGGWQCSSSLLVKS